MISITLFCCFQKVFIHMSTWMIGKIHWTSLPEKEDFYSNLNMKDITDTDYMHAKWVFKDFEIKKKKKKLVNTIIFIFKMNHYCQKMNLTTFRGMCLQIYELDPAYFLSAPGLVYYMLMLYIFLKLMFNILKNYIVFLC